jgi:hypothetical protein
MMAAWSRYAASPIGFRPREAAIGSPVLLIPGDEGEVERGRSGIAVAPLCFIMVSGVPHVPLDTPGEC